MKVVVQLAIVFGVCIATSSARGQSTCPAAGSCITAHQNPGCENVDCCQLVCSADPFCCQSQWDSTCADEGWAWCVASCGAVLAGDCLAPHEDPACSDPSCCDTICTADPFCCQQQWDDVCAQQAYAACVVVCGGSLSNDCLLPHENPSCNDADCCDAVCASDPFCCQQQWDEICSGQAWELCVQCGLPISGSCYQSHTTPGCSDAACCQTVCSYDSFCCLTQWDAACAQGADDLCSPCGVPTSGSCFAPHGAGCDDQICCLGVCVVDAFCCLTQWDSTCVAEAIDLCSACGSPSAGGCYSPQPTPYCSDTTCCNAVCAADSFCCDVQWDASCAAEAAESCAGCGAPESPSCLLSHGTSGCDDVECCATVCATDPYCCNFAWDQVCTQEAASSCSFPPCYGLCEGDFDANGVVNAVDLAVILGAWGTSAACGDVDGSGVVNAADLAQLLGNWGSCIP